MADLNGAVAAPAAACSRTPVPIPGSDRFPSRKAMFGGGPLGLLPVTENFDIGPRGICMVSDNGEIWCRGAIPTPRKLVASSVSISRGDDASACAVDAEGAVSCWGEAYSPPGALDQPVRVALEQLPAPPINPNPAFVDSGPTGTPEPWGKSCLVNQECSIVAGIIPRCPAGTKAKDWAALASSDGKPIGKRVSVRGYLALGRHMHNLPMCSELDPKTGERLPVRACCANTVSAPVVIEDRAGALVIGNHHCLGDESRICCDLAVRGQAVIASGILATLDDIVLQPAWKLDGDVSLCLPSP